ncbi:MAG: hypothetical protein QXG05_03150 [Nitrososphaerota archaeon]
MKPSVVFILLAALVLLLLSATYKYTFDWHTHNYVYESVTYVLLMRGLPLQYLAQEKNFCISASCIPASVTLVYPLNLVLDFAFWTLIAFAASLIIQKGRVSR